MARYAPNTTAHEKGPKKRTSIGHSNRTRPKNKNKRRQKSTTVKANKKRDLLIPLFFYNPKLHIHIGITTTCNNIQIPIMR